MGLPATRTVDRVYSFADFSQVQIAETITFSARPGKDAGYEYSPAAPEGPWDLVTAGQTGTDTTYLGSTLSLLRFKTQVTKETELRIQSHVTIAASPLPTESGAVLEFYPRCRAAADCKIRFVTLPSGSRAELWSDRRRQKGVARIPQLLLAKEGESIEFSGEDLSTASSLVLKLAGEKARTTARNIWLSAQTVTEAEYGFTLSPQGIVSTSLQVQSPPAGHPAMALYNPPYEAKRFLLGRMHNIDGGWIAHYADSSLHWQQGAVSAGYSLMDAVARNPEGRPTITLSLSALQTDSSDLTRAQRWRSFITYHRPISIALPPGFEASAELVECIDHTPGQCGETRIIEARTEHQPGKIIITPAEAQVAGLWLITLRISKGEFSEPGFFERLSFAFAHYHKFGRHPRWIFWFYLIGTLGSLTLLIVIITLLARRKHHRREQKKVVDQEQQVIAPLLKHDPQFDLAAFKARGRTIAERIQQAWCAGDMRDCRRFLSQGVYNRFRLQLKIMRELEKRQNAMADFRIDRFTVTERHRSGEFEALIVRLDAGARDVMVSSEFAPTAALSKAQAAPFQQFTEYYTFMRRRKAVTAHKESVDACAHCGTPFSAEGEITKCKSCGSIAGSGSHDWVLAEITQASEYRRHARRIKTGDTVSPDRIEDRASFIFWRDLMARLSGNVAFIQRDASESYLSKKPSRENLHDIAVGAAELESYNDSAAPIEARVRIKWSAAGVNDSEPRHRQSVLTLVAEPKYTEHREPNARDNKESVFRMVSGPDVDDTGFAEHSCSSCGAPLPETDSETCSYCRSTIARRNKDWLLAAIETVVE